MFLELVKGAALLLALGQLQSFSMRLWLGQELPGRLAQGLLFGGICVIGMMTPLTLAPGVIFDARSVVLSLAALFGGAIVGLVGATVAGAYRLYLGGPGASVGVAVICSSVALGNSLGLTVIAEGVETTEQRDFLLANACRAYQGYLFSKPLPIAAFELYLKAQSDAGI